jgi:tetrahydromethanopterin S-methyltransferase subunit G
MAPEKIEKVAREHSYKPLLIETRNGQRIAARYGRDIGIYYGRRGPMVNLISTTDLLYVFKPQQIRAIRAV